MWDPDQRASVLERLDQLVIKPVAEAGGYGLVIGPHATEQELADVAKLIEENPRNYIAQEVVALSRHPCLVDDHMEGRHVDLRPFVLSGEQVEVVPGGLTRVALRKGSLIVNSSQGGGSKDTWVLAPEPTDDEEDDEEDNRLTREGRTVVDGPETGQVQTITARASSEMDLRRLSEPAVPAVQVQGS